LLAVLYGEGMDVEQSPALRPPEGLRPAQLGIVLVGRMIVGHVSATLADLAQRGFLGLEEVRDSTDEDWLLTDLRKGDGTLLDFELTLLNGVFDGKSVVRLSELGEAMVPSLNQMRAQLRRDAVRHGWLRHWIREKRTTRGETLLSQIQGFRRELRALAAQGDSAPASGLVPYAMVFGLAHGATASLPGGNGATGKRSHEGEIAWAQGDRLTQGWLGVCGKLPADTSQPWMSRPDDFAHTWSAPHGHRSDHVHAPGHTESHGGYGGHVGGGHFDGGGHGGH